MTKKEFKYAMQRGLGRCIIELKNTENIEKYREIVLWGCSHELAYDAQIEGGRTYYLYQMIRMFPTPTPFIEEIGKCLDNSIHLDGWQFFKAGELLSFFAGEGDSLSFHKLQQCYDKLLQIMLENSNGSKNGLYPERDNFENLCIFMVSCRKSVEERIQSYLDIITDIGRLICSNSICSQFTFDWFQLKCEEMIGKKRIEELLREREHGLGNEGVYIRSRKEEIQRRENRSSKQVHTLPNTAEEIYAALKREKKMGNRMTMPLLLLRRLQQKGLQQEVQKFVDCYMDEKDEDMKSRMLLFFAHKKCAGLLEVEQLMKDAQSENEDLREMALTVMGYVKNDMVHDYAIALAKTSMYNEEVISMLATNYRESDYELLVSLVKDIPISYEEGKWHGAFQDVSDLLKDKSVKNPPEELLKYMYETTLCSNCRESYVEEMERRGMLTQEILQECLYDSNDVIRKYAKMKGEKNI